ncbi:MAG TPA: DUF1572 family protein [Cyclobacteriaceae bacterium]|jgi:uncharacterized damage-inducible protein DinB|nr:DinB family protein [Cytophagales bacterium]HRE66538.1 DUF1572 family protein [Cyclobacteriaceae bacterium]HRF31928.1 DUF1572 family protein [Cyclobacteriaceae bacterium]
MLNQTLTIILTRDLQKLKSELELYTNESSIWKVDKGISNTAGNLCLHLVGNLNTYIGETLGHTGYIRNRDAEFALKNISRQELIEKIDATIAMINTILPGLNEKTLKAEFPLLVLKEKTSTEYFLVHLAVHLGYHLGQVNYHRRLLD